VLREVVVPKEFMFWDDTVSLFLWCKVCELCIDVFDRRINDKAVLDQAQRHLDSSFHQAVLKRNK
jgi:hypothetical protein